MTRIILTASEMTLGAMGGVMRHVHNRKLGRTPTSTDDEGGHHWQFDIEAAMAELALAKYLNQYWRGKGEQGDPDVGDIHEVRVSRWEDGPLRIKKKDHDNRPYWLVVGEYGQYRIAGWYWARDAKRDDWWDNRYKKGFAYWVPQSELLAPDNTSYMEAA